MMGASCITLYNIKLARNGSELLKLSRLPIIYTMASKRSLENGADAAASKKHRSGFKVGPDNLPDGIHRRKGKLRQLTQHG